ncbi:hypothetical protein MJ563_27005 [Klebsiella pneumoniae]|nr:hypothetical protein MJ563_27005 [Klebsiella pneumoniae]
MSRILYKHRFYVFTMDLFSSTKICAKDSQFGAKGQQKTPPERGFYQHGYRW